jgi:hypothetical protein
MKCSGDGNTSSTTKVAFGEKSFEKVRRHLAKVEGRGGSFDMNDDDIDDSDRIYVMGGNEDLA